MHVSQFSVPKCTASKFTASRFTASKCTAFMVTAFAVSIVASGCKPTATTNESAASGSSAIESPVLKSAETAEITLPSSGVTNESEATPAIQVSLVAGELSSKLAPRYSPPGKGLKLTPFETPAELGVDGLKTEVQLGWPLDKVTPVQLLVTRSAADAAYSKLYIDADGDGKFTEPAVEAKMSDSRGLVWSNFDAVLKVNYASDQATTEDYPVVFWLTVDKPDVTPDVLRMSRRGYKSGEAQVGDSKATIVLSDSNNDAVLGKGDWWELRGDDGSAAGAMRNVGDFAWLGNRAYKLEIENVMGSSARLVPFDPGVTLEEDAIKRDPYGADRSAVRADKPLPFFHDVDAVIARATENKLPCFIKFETSWCGPCKMMTENVFTAKDVVEAAEGVVCVKVDGDERKDLVERFQVKGYPTGIMLSATGEEAARFLGYQSVPEMAAFFKDKRMKP